MTEYRQMQIEETSFMIPEGRWRARLIDVSTRQKGEDEEAKTLVRLLFAVEVPGSTGIKFLAARNFHPNLQWGSALHAFLYGWLGENLRLIEEDDGDLRALVGREGEVLIRHWHSGQDKPFVNIESIRPLGSVPVPPQPMAMRMPRVTLSAPSTTSNSNRSPAMVIPAQPTVTSSTCPCCGAVQTQERAIR